MINDIKNWFARSETILWARIQLAAGIIWTVLSTSDLAPLLDPKWLTYWLIFSGIVTEFLRRRGTETVVKMLPDGEPAKVLEPVAPAPPTV
jgi:hypothetical protein